MWTSAWCRPLRSGTTAPWSPWAWALTGAIITERVYTVPGAGGLLVDAIGKYDNAVIVGVTLFYAVLSVISIILGDILMAMVDPRISFSDKAR